MLPICDEFTGKVVIVTGGNKGIGAGCVEAFCRAGATVIAGARDRESGENLVATLNANGPGTCEFRSCDVSDHNQIREMVEQVVARHGRLDCMINNAGYLPRRRSLDEISVEDFERLLRTNLVGVFSGCKYALPHLRKTGGSIINIGSVLGITGQDGSSLYTASKGAIAAFSKSVALDEARNGVRVNVILPGNITSDLGKENHDLDSDDEEEAKTRSSLVQWIRRAGTPLEIGWAALYLASSMASFVTGAEFLVSGGFELGNGLHVYRDELKDRRVKDLGIPIP